MEDRPLASVITPCYNSESYIARYLDCILRQTYSPIQLILVNDGSVDRTEEIIQSYMPAFQKKGIQVTYQYQQNKGLGGAINTGLKLVEGAFFTWCDSDNLLTEVYFQENIRYFLEHPEAAIVRCDGYNVLDSDIHHPLGRMSDGIVDKYEKHLFVNCITCTQFYFGCTMLRTAAFDAVNPEREIYPSREGQNWQIMLPMFYRYESHYIDKPMFYFVIREDSISHVAKHRGMDYMIAQNNACEELEAIVIRGMHIPEEAEYLAMNQKQYAIIRFWIADQFGAYDLLRKEYETICRNHWNTELLDQTYRRWRNPVWRVCHKLKKTLGNRKG